MNLSLLQSAPLPPSADPIGVIRWAPNGAIIILVITVLAIVISRLSKEASFLKQALSEETGNASGSRLLLLISGVSAIYISFVFVMFYMESWLAILETCDNGVLCKHPLPDFKGLTEALLALGIGVVPYGFNKVSKAIESKKKSPTPGPTPNSGVPPTPPSLTPIPETTLPSTLTETSKTKQMKTITYKVTIYGGQGHLAIAVANQDTIYFNESGEQSHQLPVGSHNISVSAAPPQGDDGKIEFEIWQGDDRKGYHTFEEFENIMFTIQVD